MILLEKRAKLRNLSSVSYDRLRVFERTYIILTLLPALTGRGNAASKVITDFGFLFNLKGLIFLDFGTLL